MGYTLQGLDGGPLAVTKQDFLNALLSNSTYVSTLEGFGGKAYKGENNDESVWEVQYGAASKTEYFQNPYLPGWMSPGANNYLYAGTCTGWGGYGNIEYDPSAFWVYDEPAAGTKAKTAGFDRDPRAYASFYMDVNPATTHTEEPLDFRPDATNYGKDFKSGTNSKINFRNNPTGAIYKGEWPFGTKVLMRKKYSYPQFTSEDGNFAPNADPFNVRVIRYADVLLMYAEACYLSGSDGTAGSGLAALNRVRARAGMQPATALNEATIIKERDMELMGEGFRYLDIVRWSRSNEWFNAINFCTDLAPGYGFKENFQIYTTSDPNIPYRNMYLPIPLSYCTRAASVGVKQNPGW
jgi:hypothetical protein